MEMVRLFTEAGETLQAIGDRYNLSRERVRQILKARGIVGGHNIDRDIPLLQSRVAELEERVTLLEAK